MTLLQDSLVRFLENLTPSMEKGFILQLRLSILNLPNLSESISEVKKLFQVAQKSKKCQLLYSFEPNVFFIYFPESNQDEIKALLMKVQFILGTSLNSDLHNKNSYYRLYYIKSDLKELKVLASDKKSMPKPTILRQKTQSLKPVLPEANFSVPFTPALLAQLEKSLFQADLSNLMRRQSVCALVGKAQPIELFEEIYVALADLKKALCPTVDIYQSPWLLDRLLETLDKRVLENISHHDAGAFKKNFSINIAVKTILSADFQTFDKSIAPEDKGSILLELKQYDIFSNLSSFLAARSFIKQQGYRFCVDMVDSDSLPFLKPDKLEADFIKLIWNTELLEKARTQSFIRALKVNNPTSIILCRVDDKRAVELGQALGLTLFQGYYIQKLLYQKSR